jgi:hypothetical protein
MNNRTNGNEKALLKRKREAFMTFMRHLRMQTRMIMVMVSVAEDI